MRSSGSAAHRLICSRRAPSHVVRRQSIASVCPSVPGHVVLFVNFQLSAPDREALPDQPQSPRWRVAQPPLPIGWSCLLDAEADAFRLGLRRRHELPDSIKNDLELGVVLFLQAVEPARKIPIRSNEPAEMDKGPHDFDVYLDGTLDSIATPCSVNAIGG